MGGRSGLWWRLKLFSWPRRSRLGPTPDEHTGLDGIADARASIRSVLDRLGLPWRDTRAALAERYGVRAHAAYSWNVVEVPGRPVSALLWPMSVQMLAQYPAGYPAGRFSGAASFSDDADLNIEGAAEELSVLLGATTIQARYNTRQCEWRAGAASVRLTCWPAALQTSRPHNQAHNREPRLIAACHVEVTTGFRPAASPQEGSEGFGDYFKAVSWAQKYARANREVMMEQVLGVLRTVFPDLATTQEAVNCHHNYVTRERHFGKDVFVTRKGVVKAAEGDLGIIPGSMGAKSFIVRGKGNRDSFCTCSHGAGRAMSRKEAKRRFTLEDHVRATEGVECRKDAHSDEAGHLFQSEAGHHSDFMPATVPI